jgi:D-arabinonate dehydratase
MKIRSLETQVVSIPLPVPVADAVRTITHRDHLIVRLTAENGATGIGFSLGYDGARAMAALAAEIFAPVVTAADVFESERLWSAMYRQSIQAGRRGAALRAISAIDIALWDLRGRLLGRPVMELLGVQSRKLRCYATGGYYRRGQKIDQLVSEVGKILEYGFTAVKLKVGALHPREDAERVEAVRRTFGGEIDILLDANGGWSSAVEAISAVRRLEEFSPYWIEEPVRADNLEAMRRVAAELDTPVATGELEATRWAFAELALTKAADILQPDATVCGGVGEWLRIAHMAASMDIPIAPHYNWDIHSQLCATIPNCLFIEYFLAQDGVKVFDSLLRNPMKVVHGWIVPRQEPGFGIELNEEEVARYRVL